MSAAKLREFANRLRDLPAVLGAKVAQASAGTITDIAQGDANQGKAPDGSTWETLADGSPATLKDTGLMLSLLRYVAIGARLRSSLGTPYAKYQIGKRHVFPALGQPLPPAYQEALKAATTKAAKEHLG